MDLPNKPVDLPNKPVDLPNKPMDLPNTTFAVEPFFNKIYTIEFSEKYHYNTKRMYSGTKIDFILGDSSIVLQNHYQIQIILSRMNIFANLLALI